MEHKIVVSISIFMLFIKAGSSQNDSLSRNKSEDYKNFIVTAFISDKNRIDINTKEFIKLYHDVNERLQYVIFTDNWLRYGPIAYNLGDESNYIYTRYSLFAFKIMPIVFNTTLIDSTYSFYNVEPEDQQLWKILTFKEGIMYYTFNVDDIFDLDCKNNNRWLIAYNKSTKKTLFLSNNFLQIDGIRNCYESDFRTINYLGENNLENTHKLVRDLIFMRFFYLIPEADANSISINGIKKLKNTVKINFEIKKQRCGMCSNYIVTFDVNSNHLNKCCRKLKGKSKEKMINRRHKIMN
jgi:hypothetical protein